MQNLFRGEILTILHHWHAWKYYNHKKNYICVCMYITSERIEKQVPCCLCFEATRPKQFWLNLVRIYGHTNKLGTRCRNNCFATKLCVIHFSYIFYVNLIIESSFNLCCTCDTASLLLAGREAPCSPKDTPTDRLTKIRVSTALSFRYRAD